MLRGYAQDELQNYEAGIADFTIAIHLDPSSATAYNNRGYAYYLSDQPELAEQDFTNAIHLDTTFSPTYGNRALLYVSTGQFKQAVQDVDRALVLGDTLNSTYYNLKGYSELQLNHPTLAVRALIKAVRLHSNYTDALSNLVQARRSLSDSIRIK